MDGHLNIWRSDGWTFVEADPELMFEFTVKWYIYREEGREKDLGHHHHHRDRHCLHLRCCPTFQDLAEKSRGPSASDSLSN